MAQTMDPNNMPILSEASVSVEIETEDMTLNIGPQHPSTHGVLRLVAKINGEKISSVEPVLGYMHRGYEKLAEVRTYPQVTTLVNSCLLYTSPSPRDGLLSRMPSSA